MSVTSLQEALSSCMRRWKSDDFWPLVEPPLEVQLPLIGVAPLLENGL